MSSGQPTNNPFGIDDAKIQFLSDPHMRSGSGNDGPNIFSDVCGRDDADQHQSIPRDNLEWTRAIEAVVQEEYGTAAASSENRSINKKGWLAAKW